jgi:DNA modification methylase
MNLLLTQGNALQIPLADESVHCVVTSPPYWGLRDYGTATWEGGDEGCDHLEKELSWSTKLEREQKKRAGKKLSYRDTCGKCGAIRIDNQLGLESTPEEYVENMVAVFREVRRVLRADGTLWLNLGDSYATGGYSGEGNVTNKDPSRYPGGWRTQPRAQGAMKTAGVGGLKPKDLCGIPWRVAFALQADGWWLRSDIIWSKPNPMPESVTDRPTKAHEYLFLLTKSARYYYDADAVREALKESSIERGKYGWSGNTDDSKFISVQAGQGFRRVKKEGTKLNELYNPAGRNRRTVWHIATAPYSGAHFATYPPALVEPCIKAGCPEGGTVFDPFAGSGTTLQVARALGRNGVGLDLSAEYLHLARQRLSLDALDAWNNGSKKDGKAVDDLPMFKELP